MRKALVFGALICLSGAAHAQSRTSCSAYGSTMNCTTTPDTSWQNQQMMSQGFANLAAGIAARRERKRQEHAAAAAAQAEAVIQAAIARASAADTAGQLPTPTDEQPIQLACIMAGRSMSLALYEKHNRVDSTDGAFTQTRSAIFTTASVNWETPVLRFTLSRLDGSYLAESNIPEVQGSGISGTCAVASQRKF